VVGHENAGIIAEAGHESGFSAGERVVADPVLGCEPRGIDPPCPECARGDHALCRNFTRGTVSAGIGIGNCRDVGGSWGEYFVAHRSQVVRIPDNVSFESALLAEPLAVALHAVGEPAEASGQTALIIGAGTVGLCLVTALKAAGAGRVLISARHPYQARMAAALGADEVLRDNPAEVLKAVSAVTGGEFVRPVLEQALLRGGVKLVYDCVGSSDSLNLALDAVCGGGQLVLAGLAGRLAAVDWTTLWLDEVRLRGTFWSGLGDTARALGLMAAGLDLAPLLTHVYPLDAYRRAFGDLRQRARLGMIKAAFSLYPV